MKLNKLKVKENVKKALEEDGYKSDLSLNSRKINKKHVAKAKLVTRQNGILSGSFWFEQAFKIIDKNAEFNWKVLEGRNFKKNTEIVEIKASIQAILSGERTALNFLQMMSGISSKAKAYSDYLKDTKIELLDTRKTLPNLRYEQKYSTYIGGVKNHRFGLFDAIMLKDNHCLLYTSPSPRDRTRSRMPSSA